MASNKGYQEERRGVYQPPSPTAKAQQGTHYETTNPAFEASPTRDSELIIAAPIAPESNPRGRRSYSENVPPTYLPGGPIAGCGALSPESLPFGIATPKQSPATINSTNNTTSPSVIDAGYKPQYALEDGQDGDYRERLKSAGDFSLTTTSNQPLDPSPDEEEEEKVPFKDLTPYGKVIRVFSMVARPLSIILLLYFFICSLNLLSSGFILIGGRMAGDAFGNNPLLSNPVCGLMIGVVSTAFLQSSSTSTSIVVTMVSSKILSVPLAIPIIMGSNIGTSVTGIFVAVTQAGDRAQFERAFSAATVHDMFNWLTVITLLPIEVATGYLYHLTSAIVSSISVSSGGSKQQFLSVLTEPFTNLIVQVDKDALQKIAAGEPGSEKLSLLKYWCETKSVPSNTTKEMLLNRPLGRYIFHGTSLSEPAVGILVLIISLAMLITCLILMVKILRSLLQSSMAKAIQKTIGADFPGKAACLTGYVALLVGAMVTILVQSSSVVASALTPIVGLGAVTVERVYPMMLGANIGTTSTAILAAFAASSDRFRASFQIAMCHLFFNLSGILMWYPLPFMRAVPIRLAKFLGRTTAQYRWFAVFYIISMFFMVPLLIFALSIPGWQVLVGVGSPIILLLILIGIMNILQKYKPQWLPEKLRTWDFLPECMRSLAPIDRKITQMINCCACCRCCKCCDKCVPSDEEAQENGRIGSSSEFADVYGIDNRAGGVRNTSLDVSNQAASNQAASNQDVTINSSVSVLSNLPGRYESSV